MSFADGTRPFLGMFISFAFLGASFAFLAWAIVWPGPQGSTSSVTRAKCDEVVETLLTSRDLVEVNRAGILIDRLNCGVSRRLPKTG